MATFVLVHGAHAGGWWWSDVRGYMRAAGHEVFTPSLTGHGERAHLSISDVTLDTHILDVVNVLRYEDLSDVILVGWSYGGMVVAGAADRCPERLAQVVYGDAFVPHDGEAAIDLAGAERWARMLRLAAAGEHAIPLEPAMADARLVPHPLATWIQPIRLAGRRGGTAAHVHLLHAPAPPGHRRIGRACVGRAGLARPRDCRWAQRATGEPARSYRAAPRNARSRIWW